ncbi:unnamed protein product, partial [Leptidea sinapis]
MLSNKRLVLACAFLFSCNIALISVYFKYNSGEKCYITIDQHQDVISYLPESFLSIGIDASEIQNFHTIDFSKNKFRELASALSPARLRLGGTMSERLIFSSDDNTVATCDSCPISLSKSLCQSEKWKEINNFCKATGLKLLFSFNVLLRNENEWNTENAQQILEYSKANGFDVDWQLGNEPNSFRHVFNITITPQMLAHDFKKLRRLLNHSGYKHSLLVGPDTTRPQDHQPNCLKYMVEFLGNMSHINIRSWHQYYLDSKTATLADFWNPDTFNLLKVQIKTMKDHTKKYNHIPMWLTETSSSYGSGAPGLSNTFAGTPLWIDKLGLAAKNNITTVIRQSFFGGNYSLVDHNLEPLPDWWASVLYKKVVGNKVLHIDCHCSRYQRLYAHCANRKYTNDTSAVTVYGVNLQMKKARFLLNGTALHGDNLIIDEFIIRAPSNNRRSKTILLNGWPLLYESPLPDFTPNQHLYGNHISMPPYSVGFWVIKNTSVNV